ncbi:MAG: dTDP-4-dehydrorhamnose 3,5-epimerase [Prosthecobacter sp.]|uniref:dTDP-4-dehydrorhamnose 3,5-epimerase n=1 Tax=Prosthecobacter sp. TaxID=1965333 RepID=UPI003BAF1764
MKFSPTKIQGCFIVDIEPRTDDRGFFARSFCRREFAEQDLCTEFVQANISFNHEAGTLRGMHWQDAPHAEVKVVRCTRGIVFDVALDLRRESPTYLQWTGVELSAENARSLYIPQGCAHGYLTLTPDAEMHYLVSAFYAPTHDRGARWDDPAFGIQWPNTPRRILSARDESHPPWQP